MAVITVRPATTAVDRRALLALPARLHGDDPAWVAPLRVLEARRLRPSNPFFREAELALFLAERDGEVVGSISVLKDRRFGRDEDERVAWFGYFEAMDDAEVAAALLERAIAQATSWGATHLRGPRNLTRFEYIGLTVEGFDRRPPMLQGHHPARYAAFLQDHGFAKHHDRLAYETPLVGDQGRPRPLPDGLRDKAEGCDIDGLTVRRARWRSLGHDLRAAHEVMNEAYQTVPDVQAMPLATFQAIGRTFLTIASTELVQLAFRRGEPIGFAVSLPEPHEILAPAQGQLLPLGWARMIGAMRQVGTVGFKLIGVKQAYRGSGLHAVLIQNVVEGAQRAGYQRLDASIIDERNKPMRAVVEHLGCTVYRRYRVFDRSLT